MRSLVGEAGQYPFESRQALAQGIVQVNQSIANALSEVVTNNHIDLPLPPLKLVALVNTCILGYAVVCLTSDAPAIWSSQEDFISTLIEAIAWDSMHTDQVVDLPPDTVHELVQQAKRYGAMNYAIAYLLFAAGLRPEELVRLHRDDYWVEDKAGILRVGNGSLSQRMVPVNQKILGHRYGSANNNPLTAYLKNRKDSLTNMFVGSDLQLLSLEHLQHQWHEWIQAGRRLDHKPLEIDQARQTWGVEMLMRGMDVENFRIISGLKPMEIQIYQQRVKEKTAINQAIALDA
jgi:hypothetical protein